MRLVFIALLGCAALGCKRGGEQPVVIVPEPVGAAPAAVPADPFGTSSPAYDKLREATDAAIVTDWSGELEDFASWLEEQTVAVEQSLASLKALRVGSRDVYAVANGRIALVYEHIATTLTKASEAAETAELEFDWAGEEALLWDRANSFWARCVRGCSTAGPHLDAWDLRCRQGLENSQAKLDP